MENSQRISLHKFGRESNLVGRVIDSANRIFNVSKMVRQNNNKGMQEKLLFM